MECSFRFSFVDEVKDLKNPRKRHQFTIDNPLTSEKLDTKRCKYTIRTVSSLTEMDEIFNGVIKGDFSNIFSLETLKNYSTDLLLEYLEKFRTQSSNAFCSSGNVMLNTPTFCTTPQQDRNEHTDPKTSDSSYRFMLTPSFLRYLAWQRMIQIIQASNVRHFDGVPHDHMAAQAPVRNWYPIRTDHSVQTVPYTQLPTIFSKYPYNRSSQKVEPQDIKGWMEVNPSCLHTDLRVTDEAKMTGSHTKATTPGIPAKRPKVDPRCYLNPVAVYRILENSTESEVVFHHCTPTVVIGRGRATRGTVPALLTPLNYLNVAATLIYKSQNTKEPLSAPLDMTRLRFISRNHATITYNEEEQKFYLCCYSRNGIIVNGQHILNDFVQLYHDTTLEFISAKRSDNCALRIHFHSLIEPPPDEKKSLCASQLSATSVSDEACLEPDNNLDVGETMITVTEPEDHGRTCIEHIN